MSKYKVVLLVSPMGHDVQRVGLVVKKWLKETGIFDVTIAGRHTESECSIEEYMTNEEKLASTDLFFFLCADDAWKNNHAEKNLARCVEEGKGVLFYHGLHPCFSENPEIEKMIGLLWREKATHGDFNYCNVEMTEVEHPITKGIELFHTKEELFCLLENKWNVPMQVLATAYSDPNVISRWGHPGTGKEEPVLTVGHYGKGRTVNFILGHVWPYYTGHGLLENTLIAMEPPQFKMLLLRSCEWAVCKEITL